MTVVFDDGPDDDWPFDWTPPVAARQPLPPGPSDRHELGDGQGRAAAEVGAVVVLRLMG